MRKKTQNNKIKSQDCYSAQDNVSFSQDSVLKF